MPRYCPAGHGAFADWVARCPGCGAALIDEEPATPKPPASPNVDEPIVYLATVANEPLAELWTAVLRDEGIPVLKRAMGAGIGGWASAAMLEHELYVLESDYARAEAIVRDLEAEERAESAT